MDLPQIHVVRAEPFQGVVQRRQQMPARSVEPAVRIGHAAGLRRDDEIASGHQAVEELPEEIFGLPTAVHIGRVDQRAARLPEGFELFRSVVLIGVPAPGEGAEPDPGHSKAGAAEMPLLHGR